VKSGVGKTCAMVGEMWCGEVEKESREDMFYHFSQKNSSRMGQKNNIYL